MNVQRTCVSVCRHIDIHFSCLGAFHRMEEDTGQIAVCSCYQLVAGEFTDQEQNRSCNASWLKRGVHLKEISQILEYDS